MIEYKVDRQITVKELIEFLQRFGPDALVNVEGCDCVGECNGVYAYNNQVTLSRR
jgi:hypothetical protein